MLEFHTNGVVASTRITIKFTSYQHMNRVCFFIFLYAITYPHCNMIYNNFEMNETKSVCSDHHGFPPLTLSPSFTLRL